MNLTRQLLRPVGKWTEMLTDAEVQQAQALVHMLRDLDADIDETEAAIKSAPFQVRLLAHALMQPSREA